MIPIAVGMLMFGFQGSSLTIDDAIKIASENAFSVRSAETTMEKTRNQVSVAKGGLGPKLTVDSTYTRFDKASTANFGGQTVVVSPIDSKQARLSATWQFDLAGNVGRAIKAADALNDGAGAQRDAQLNDLRLRVRQGYYAVLQAQELLKVAEQAQTNNRERVKQAQSQFEAGVIAKIDVLRFETQLAQADADVLAAKNRLRLAKQVLNNTLGRPIETTFDVVPVQVVPTIEGTPEGYIAEAMSARPDVRAQKLNVEALMYVRLAEQRGLSPTLNLSAVHQRNIDAQGFGARSGSSTGTLLLSWPVFDSGITRSRVHSAQRDEELAGIALEQLTLGISLEVRQALSNLADAKERLDVSSKQVALAEEAFRLAKIRYEAGEGIQLEVTDAQTQLTQAQAGEVGARYDYLNAFATLQRATALESPKGQAAAPGEVR